MVGSSAFYLTTGQNICKQAVLRDVWVSKYYCFPVLFWFCFWSSAFYTSEGGTSEATWLVSHSCSEMRSCCNRTRSFCESTSWNMFVSSANKYMLDLTLSVRSLINKTIRTGPYIRFSADYRSAPLAILRMNHAFTTTHWFNNQLMNYIYRVVFLWHRNPLLCLTRILVYHVLKIKENVLIISFCK